MAARKDVRNPVFAMRMDPKLRADLQKEADLQKRSLAAHITFLLETHPDRKKKR